jgi:hypothetical protein
VIGFYECDDELAGSVEVGNSLIRQRTIIFKKNPALWILFNFWTFLKIM